MDFSKAFFQTKDGRVKIFHQDALCFLRALPSESVDVITTDPAYSGMNQHLQLGRGRIVGKYENKGKDGSKWFEEFHDTEENYTAFLDECYRVLKPDRHIYIMFDSFSLLTLAPLVRNVFDVKNLIVWDKVNIGMGHYFRRRHEFVLFATKGKRPLSSHCIPDVWRIKRVAAYKYPTQKPVELFEAMLAGSAEEGYVVCDPFLGSGSSAIAAVKRGCGFIGSDVAESAIRTCRERLESYMRTGKDTLQPKSLLVEGEDYAWMRAIM
jgi:site-specific DNA-methyltransferase (adenine-specific)